MIGIDDIVQVPDLGIPKTRAKTIQASRQRLFPSFVELAANPQGVQPESLNFHRLADPWRHYPIADFSIHPGQLDAGNSGR